jgi:hypothetical protein
MLRMAREAGAARAAEGAGPPQAGRFDRKAAAAALLAVYDEARSTPKR